jgi:hypothetical protein
MAARNAGLGLLAASSPLNLHSLAVSVYDTSGNACNWPGPPRPGAPAPISQAGIMGFAGNDEKTSNENRGGRRYLPYAFTEHGYAVVSAQ